MRPKKRSIGPQMSAIITPYEGHRRRVRLMERVESLRKQVSVSAARRRIATATRLSPDQLVNIRKGRLKDLYGDVKTRIDEAFIDWARGFIGDLEHELVLAHACRRGVDPGVVLKAEASLDALEALIAEARVAMPIVEVAEGPTP